MRIVWRVLNALMTVLFVFAVVVQYNDPDPVRWMLVYGAAAVASGLVAADRPSRVLSVGTTLAATAWAIAWRASMDGPLAPLGSLFEQFEMKNINVEETREVLGLCIVAGWCFFCSAYSFVVVGGGGGSGSKR